MSIKEIVNFMKNKSISRIGRVFNRLINIRFWSDWDRAQANSHYLLERIKFYFVPQKPQETETFEQAKKRLQLSDADLLARQKGFIFICKIMLVWAAFFLIYAAYLFYTAGFIGGILSLVAMFLALTFAFRYHFWSFQIKQRQLGCTIYQWFKMGLLGEQS